ncbi:MAG: indole-3-glycerol phosphate synthase TrpC [Alphaproteobacteria bacterium]
MSDILKEICDKKRIHIAQKKKAAPLAVLEERALAQTDRRSFVNALKIASKFTYGLICEIKKASPSKGVIREDFDVAAIAHAYSEGGATCISVLTDEPYFQGHDDFVMIARKAASLPILRKDFILDPYQVVESKALGADCILLIMAALDDETALLLEKEAMRVGLDVLIEVHDEAELTRALKLSSPLIGINNRNLKTMETKIETTFELAQKVPTDRIVVSESGIFSAGDLEEIALHGPRCFLIGESLMRQKNIRQAVQKLF